MTLLPSVVSAAATGPTPSRPDLGSPLQVNTKASATHNPHHNIAPHPNYFNVCSTRGRNNPQCIKAELAAIRHARSREKIKKRAMILPRNFTKLTVHQQTFVVTDLERVDRGLKPFKGLTSSLNATSHVAAVGRLDASIAAPAMRAHGIQAYGSIWAGDLGPISADYDWMYNDGYSKSRGINLACVKPGDTGCWGHRENILNTYRHLPNLVAGAGTSTPPGASIAEILTAGSGKTPKLVYSWKQALAHGANGHHIRTRRG
jgi:hypothetical protein